MTILVWNVRGLNDPLKQKGVVSRIRELKVNLACLIETRVKEQNMENIIRRHFVGWKVLSNYSNEASNGRIWFLWNSLFHVELVDYMDQCITCIVSQGTTKFLFSAIYGRNEGIDRRRLWSHLSSLKASNLQLPWMLAGDFNVIAHSSESSNFNGTQATNSNMKDFVESMHHLEVLDHVYNGPLFTWSNHQDSTFLAKKLDRALINDTWLTLFAHSRVEFLPPELSDHSPAFIQLDIPLCSTPKPFKFFNFWVKHSSFQATVRDSWMLPMSGSPMVRLHRKLKRLKQCLKSFNKEFFSNISIKVKEKRVELAKIQDEILSFSCAGLVQIEKRLTSDLYELMQAEESFYKQKSRVQWLKEGDSNTGFFFKTVAARQHRNAITNLTDASGNKISSAPQLATEVVGYFQSLIGTEDAKVSSCPLSFLTELLPTFSDEAQSELIRPVTSDEIKKTIYGIDGDKAPRPDGFSTCFFKSY